MESPFIVPLQLETGPISPTVGHGASAWSASLILHAAAAILGISIGVRESIDVPVTPGETGSQAVIQLSAAQLTASAATAVLVPWGDPESDSSSPPPTLETSGEAPREIEPLLAELPAVLLPMTFTEIELPVDSVPKGDPNGQPGPEVIPDSEPPPVVEAPPESDSEAEVADANVQAAQDALEKTEASMPAAEAPATVESTSTPSGAQVDTPARPAPSNPPPVYPPAADLENRQGRTILRVEVDAKGKATKVEVIQSSGHKDLDNAAVAAVRNWHFLPAMKDESAVAQTIAVPIRFVDP